MPELVLLEHQQVVVLELEVERGPVWARAAILAGQVATPLAAVLVAQQSQEAVQVVIQEAVQAAVQLVEEPPAPRSSYGWRRTSAKQV